MIIKIMIYNQHRRSHFSCSVKSLQKVIRTKQCHCLCRRSSCSTSRKMFTLPRRHCHLLTPVKPHHVMMGCHLTLAITRSSHELLSHVKKNIGTHPPQPQHPLRLPQQTEVSQENNRCADDGFSVFSGLMTCPLLNSAVFHPCQSLEFIPNNSIGGRGTVFTDAGCNFELVFFFFDSDKDWMLPVVILSFSHFEHWLLTGFDAHNHCFTVPNQSLKKTTTNKCQIMFEISYYWQHSQIRLAHTLTPWTLQRLIFLNLWSCLIWSQEVYIELQCWLLFLLVVAIAIRNNGSLFGFQIKVFEQLLYNVSLGQGFKDDAIQEIALTHMI